MINTQFRIMFSFVGEEGDVVRKGHPEASTYVVIMLYFLSSVNYRDVLLIIF